MKIYLQLIAILAVFVRAHLTDDLVDDDESKLLFTDSLSTIQQPSSSKSTSSASSDPPLSLEQSQKDRSPSIHHTTYHSIGSKKALNQDPISSHNVHYNMGPVGPLDQGVQNNLTESSLLKSLKSLKLINSLTNKKKNVYPGIVIQNFEEKQLNEDISNDLTKFGAYSKLLSQLMHSIVNKELGLSTVQQSVDSLSTQTSTIKYETVIDDISDKMLRKIEDIHSIIEITGERIQEIFKQQLNSNITTSYMSCCDVYTSEFRNDYKTSEFTKLYSLNSYNSEYDLKLLNSIKSKEQEVKNGKYQFDNHFNAWINKKYSCDIGDDFRKAHFFSPSGPNLTEQFKANLAQYSNIKWQYFMSFLGVHTEYPSYLPPNNYCFLHNFNNEQMNPRYKPNNERDNDKIVNFSNGGFLKRYKLKNKKHDSFHHHRKAYNELNQLFSQRHLENLFTTALPQNKLVVIVIDRGSALTDHQLNIAKSVAKYITNSLSHKDKVGIVDLTSDVQHPSSELCSSKLQLAYANYETKHFYGRYIDELQRSHNSTNHHLGFKRAFEVIANNYQSFKDEIGTEPEILIAYISRGLLAYLADAKRVMQLISGELSNTTYSFVINSYALIDETKPIMYETTFLKEVAAMNFKKFNVEPPPQDKIRSGIMVALNNTDNLSFTLNGIYSVLSKPDSDSYSNIYISLPHYDFMSKDTHVSISKAFLYRDLFIGVVGADISFFDLAEDVVHYDSPNSYAFLMDAHSGRLLYHPIFSHHTRYNPKRQTKFSSSFNYDYYFQNSFTNVEHVEQANDFYPVVKRMIMTKSAGVHTIKLSFPFSDSSSFNNDSYFHFLNDRQQIFSRFSTITYYWRRVSSSPYIVVVAVYGNDKFSKIPFNNRFHLMKAINYSSNESKLSNSFVSHRLDYLTAFQKSNVKLCKHFNQLATTETAALYLTPGAFVNPYKYEVNLDSFDMVQQYMRYLTDSSMMMENPGLKSNVRGDVSALGTMIDLWKQLLESSETSKYTIRKYVSTTSGAFMVYPGALLDQSYDPKTRPWYTRAISNPGKIIFMPPYLDIGGGGYIVTLSQTIYEGKSNGIHSDNDQIWGVVGIDLTLGYFHKIIDEMVPICNETKASCFIMDDYGYLIVHSSFLKPTLTPFIERQHITHKESQMVNDLLNQKHFVRKLICNSFTDRTIQRYYMFNSSLVGILTNIVQNEDPPCAKYKLVSLDSSNAFFGIVNHTCDNSTTFCPCSLTDRLCLNCHRMEQTDCECPCECPLIMNLCSGQLFEKEDKNPSCVSMPEPLREPNIPKYLFDSLESCINSECFNKHSESDCKGVLGCEWCSMDNGLFLKKPFCTNQNLCFGGIYGSKNPYLNNFYYHHHESYKPTSNGPIGPLTTTIIICFIILAFSVYCFQSSRNFGGRYLSSNHTAGHPILPPSNESNDNVDNEFNNNDGNFEAVAALVQAASVNSNFENIASPYQINNNYRRPVPESDYGYSTMTPNDDSELNGPVYINPNIIKLNKKSANGLDLLDISTSPTMGSESIVSNDDMSTLSSPSSSSSFNTSHSINEKRLPPPPSSKSSYKIRTKQKYIDKQQSKHLLSNEIMNGQTILPTLKESSLLDEINEVNVI